MWLLRHLVPRTLVREQRGRDRAYELAVVERTELAAIGHLADHCVRELPLRADDLGLGESLGLDDGNHPLLALRDHDFPRLELLAERDAVELDVDARAVSGHLGQG
jgi:hypothetical protein